MSRASFEVPPLYGQVHCCGSDLISSSAGCCCAMAREAWQHLDLAAISQGNIIQSAQLSPEAVVASARQLDPARLTAQQSAKHTQKDIGLQGRCGYLV